MTAPAVYSGVTALPDVLEESAVDTRRFGRSIGRLVIAVGAVVEPAAIAQRFAESDLDTLVVRYPAQHTSWFAALSTEVVRPLHADNLIYFAGVTEPLPQQVDEPGLADASALDSGVLARLTREIFADYPNHYTANPFIDAGRVTAGYEEWVDRHLRAVGQDVIVLGDAGELTGLAALTIDDNVSVDLAGVAPSRRGRGLYETLLRIVSDRGFGSGAASVTISTQTHNTAPMRTWVTLGWKPVVTLETVHLIRRDEFGETPR